MVSIITTGWLNAKIQDILTDKTGEFYYVVNISNYKTCLTIKGHLT